MTVYVDPYCEHCEGRGYLDVENTNSVIPCNCRERAMVISFVEQSGIPSKYRGATIRGYKTESPNEVMAKEEILTWIKNFEVGCRGVIFTGPVGTGKTHMLCAAAIGVIKQAKIVPLYRCVSDLLREAKQDFNKSPDDYSVGIFDKAVETDVLLLDDLGAEQTTEWAVTVISDIIDERYRSEKTTLITTNLTLDDIAKRYDQRIASRLREMSSVLLLDGPDRRQMERVA